MHKNWGYTNKPLANKLSLFRLLETNEKRLTYLLKNKRRYFKTVLATKNGKTRTTYKVVGELLKIHEHIKKHIFSKIILPEYITGGKKGVGYIDDCKTHCDKSILIQEDIKKFFPSITKELITEAFQYYMNFSPEVSSLLANISTLDDSLVQGTVLSTDIANLIFLEEEVLISKEIKSMGGVYTRYVDDITIGFMTKISNGDITKVKKMVASMVIKRGLKLNRKKSEVMRDGQAKIVHGVKVIKDVRPTKERKSNIRICLFNFSKKITDKEDVIDILSLYFKIRGLANTLKQQGDVNHAEYMKEANRLITGLDKKGVIKSIRAMRKVKDVKKLRTLYSKLKPLGKVSENILTILDAEYKTCKGKLCNKSIKLSA
ncbi:reverse transcriptase family protein [Enterobacteriaceae bacterium LUAb1]